MSKSTKYFYFIFFCSLVSYFLLINTITPYMGDDLTRVAHMRPYLGEPWNILSNAAAFTFQEYFDWTGRVVVTFITYAFLTSPILLNIINAFILCLFFHAIFLNVTLRQPKILSDLSILILILSMFWWLIPQFGEVMFLKTISIGYLWVVTGTLYFLYPLLKLLLKNEDLISNSLSKKILMAIAGFLLGNGLENLSMAVCLLLIFMNTWIWIKHRTLPTWLVVASIMYLLGAFFLIAAPGNYARVAFRNEQISSLYYNNIIEKIYIFTVTILQHNIVLLSVLFLIIFFTWRSLGNKMLFFLFLGLSVISAYAMIGAPSIIFVDRKTFCSDVFMVMAIFSLLQGSTSKKMTLFIQSISLILLCSVGLSMSFNYYDAKSIHQQMEFREKLMAIYRKNNLETIFLPSLYFVSANKSTYGQNFTIFRGHMVVLDLPWDSKRTTHGSAFLNYHDYKHFIMKPFILLWPDIDKISMPNPNEFGFSYFVQDKTLFIYNKKGSCDSYPYKDPLFLHVYPKKLNFLSKQQASGFKDIQIPWNSQYNKVTVITSEGKIKQDICVMYVRLPHYPIEQIQVGQYGNGQTLWKFEIAKVEQINLAFLLMMKLDRFIHVVKDLQRSRYTYTQVKQTV